MLLTIPIPDSHKAVRLPPGIVDGDEDGFFQYAVGMADPAGIPES